MKKILLLFALVLCSALYEAADAQVSFNVNIGSQPVWGPAGYDYAENYYFPDIDVYYNVPARQFTYFNGRNWVANYSLPDCYSRFDLYNSYKVVINEPRPFLRNDFWHSRYASYRGYRQENIYNSPDSRYFIIKEHPQHERWMAASRNYDHNDRDRYNDRRFDNYRSGDIRRNDRDQYNDRRFDNHMSRDMGRNDRDRNNNYGRPTDNRRGNYNERGNGGWRN